MASDGTTQRAGKNEVAGLSFLDGGGELGQLILGHDWASTSLGPLDSWPQSLKTAVGMTLLSPVPIVLLWGEDGIMIYNDAYSDFAGARHPELLGSKVREGWPEVADFNDNVMRVVLAGGTLSYKDQELTLHRSGSPEQVWMNLDYSPILDEEGKPAGVIAIVVETTQRLLSEKRLRESEERFRALANASSDVIYRMNADWSVMSQLDGRGFITDTTEPRANWIDGYIFPEDQPRVQAAIDETVRTRKVFELEHRVRRADGSVGWTSSRAVPLVDEGGEIVEWFGTASDITERKRTENLRATQNRVLQLVVRDSTLSEMLEALVHAVESESDSGVIGSILLLDEDRVHLRHGAAPSLSESYNAAIDGIAIGPNVGSCGTAAFKGEPVYVSNIETDPLWIDFRTLALANDLRACWSTPIVSGRGQLLGTFAMYYNAPREPVPQDLELVDLVTRSAALIIERKRGEQALRESEERFRQVFENAAVGMIEIDADWNILKSNAAYRDITARTEADLEGANCLSFTHPEDVTTGERALRDLAAGNAHRVAFEKRYLHHDGQTIWVRSSLSRVSGDNRENRFLKVVEDITDVREAREALREESEALEILNRTAAQVAAELDLDRLVQIVTDAGVELTGAQFGAFFYNVVDRQGERYTLYSLSGVERSHFDKFPMPRNTDVFAPTFRGEGVVRSADITNDPRYGKMAPHYGMPKGHLPVRSYLAVSVVSRSGEVIGGLFFGHEKTGVFAERSERLMIGLAAQAAIGIDNARLFQAEQRLNENLEAKVAERTAERDRIWQVSQDLLGVADADGTWRSVNPAWTRVLGWEANEIVGRKSDWLEHEDDHEKTRQEIEQLSAGGLTLAFENRLRTRSGEYRTFSWTAVPLEDKIYAVARDITEERRRQDELEQTQDRLRQAQKMETVGQLTGGVAHDFNNLLQIVTGNLEILQMNLPDSSPRLKRAAENAQKGAQRAATLTQRLLAFSRRQPLAPKPLDANKLVAGMSDLLHRTLGEIIAVETVLAPGLWRVHADPNQLENALLNLAINARDAMPGGGKLTIETQNAHLDHGYVAQNAEVTPGQYVMICISDTGKGIEPDALVRVFEPFFTTKEVGKGTGLGLSMVYGFVKQSGGNVKIYSEVGEGTTVKIYLPRLIGSADEDDELVSPWAPEGTREETILVLEDDDDVRAYSVDVLRDLGYRVLEAHDGPSALRLLERQEGRVDLLFSDVVLPGGMTGAEVAREARQLRPELKVLFTTGYARNAIVHHGRLDPGVELITKPFAHADLASRIRDLLDKD